MKSYYNTLIIGSGCAGYATAERLHRLGVKNIALITEGREMGTSRNTGSDKQTYYKLSLCGGEGDSVREMADTLYSGGGVMGEHALCEAAYSTRCFMHLCELGVPFPTNEYGEYAGYKTDHDPRSRATSCGPLTSRLMTEALERAASEREIEIIDNCRVIRVLTRDRRVSGIAAADTRSGEIRVIGCSNVVLATGGPAGIYKNTVYPQSQHGATGLAIEAGAELSNMDQWQYGIASIGFRWNLSGSYQQVVPRYFSLDGEGVEREFLYDALGASAYGYVFLKGYQWPFDTRKLEGSSQIDLLVAEQIKSGRRVFMDFTRDPKGFSLGALPDEAREYLIRSGATEGRPIDRLEAINKGAIELYADRGIDLRVQPLEIAVCAQHCNGGVAVDGHWQSSVEGLYAVGEAAGTFGVYRPGGSALNSTQVGAIRAAEHIAARSAEMRERGPETVPEYVLPEIRYGESNIAQLLDGLQSKMSRAADFERDTRAMREHLAYVTRLRESFFEIAQIEDKRETAELFKLYDTVLTQCAALSAMLLSAELVGTHGAAIVDGKREGAHAQRDTRTVTVGFVSRLDKVSSMPEPELWFETLLARQRGDINGK